MAITQVQGITTSISGYLTTWTQTSSFQSTINGNKGAQEAQDILARIINLQNSFSEVTFKELLTLTESLNSVKPVFSSQRKFASHCIILICGILCARHLSNQSIQHSDQIPRLSAIDFDDQLISSPHFTHIPNTQEQTLIYIDLETYNQSNVQRFLDDCGTLTPFQVADALLKKINRPRRAFVFLDSDLKISPQRARAFLRASVVNSGAKFHTPRSYTGANKELVRISTQPAPTDAIEQFTDSLYVLSECYAESDVLNRFLRLYQSIENFMVRRQVISVQNGTGNDTFSIRDFRRLYDQVAKNEQETLNELFEKTLSVPTTIGGNTIAQIIADRWHSQVLLSADHAEISSSLFRTMGSLPKSGNIFDTTFVHNNLGRAADRHKTLGSFVYKFRNMIVHNKETEFHLTHSNMPKGVELFMNNFLLPTLDDIVFTLLNVDKNIVWYPKPTIALY